MQPGQMYMLSSELPWLKTINCWGLLHFQWASSTFDLSFFDVFGYPGACPMLPLAWWLLRWARLLQVMAGLGGLGRLRELWLGRNKIREVDLTGLPRLLRLSLQSNRLTRIAGFQVRAQPPPGTGRTSSSMSQHCCYLEMEAYNDSGLGMVLGFVARSKRL
jgi:Leucine-rich repeat (LRR) protein